MAKNLPRIICEARAKLRRLVCSRFFRYGRAGGVRAMRKDYAEHCIAVLDTMLLSCCLEFDGKLCRVADNYARPLTVPEMAILSEVHQRTVERIIRFLRDLGLLSSEKQFRRLFDDGLKVAAVWRVFTKLFWEKLGLWGLFVESVKYAAEHAKLKSYNPLKLIGKLIGNKFTRRSKITDEQRRQSARNTQMFLDMSSCPNQKNAKTCCGGKKPAEICELCRRLSH